MKSDDSNHLQSEEHRFVLFISHACSYVLFFRLVNEIDEFEHDDAQTSNNITVSSFRSTGLFV